MSAITLTVWQSKRGLLPTRAGEERLEEPSAEAFGAAALRLLSSVDEDASPFQIVARVGDSSRSCQLVQGWNEAQVLAELWARYEGLARVNG